MNDVYLCVASNADKCGLNVKSWTSLWFSEIFLYCEKCLSAAESLLVCVCVRQRVRYKWPFFKLQFSPPVVANIDYDGGS